MEHAKKRIAIDTTYMDGRKGMGTAIWIRETVNALKQYKDEFDITLIHRESIPDDPLYREFKEIIIPKIKLPRYGGFVSELVFFLTTRERFDIYYFAYSRLNPFFWVAPARKIMYAAMDGGPQTANYAGYKKTIKVPAISRMFFGKIDAFIALSDFGKDGIVETYKIPVTKVHTIYCGVDKRFAPLPRSDEILQDLESKYGIHGPYILDVSRFDPHKNILGLIRAYRRLIDETGCAYNLVFVGGRHTPSYSAEVDRLICELNLEERVIVTPFVSDDDLPKIYAQCEFFAFPSFYEGFGMPAVESMACGIPVLVSDISSLREVTGGNAEYIDPYDDSSLIEGLKKMLDPGRRDELARSGLEFSRKFTWENSVRDLTAIFRAL